MSKSSSKQIAKTLSCGFGHLFEYNHKTDELKPLDDKKRRMVYRELREESKSIGMSINQCNSRRYAREVLGAGDKVDELKTTSYKPIVDRLDRVVNISGSILSQVYGISQSDFSGEHWKDLFAIGSRTLPTHRIDGTHPIPLRGTELRLLCIDNQFYLAANIFSEKGSENINQKLLEEKEEREAEAKANGKKPEPEVFEPSDFTWLAFKIIVKRRDKSLHHQLMRVVSGMEKLSNKELRNSSLDLVAIERELKDKWIEDDKIKDGWEKGFKKALESKLQSVWKNKLITDGEWLLGNGKLKYQPTKNRKWMGQISVLYIPEPYKAFDENISMGIDLGMTCPVVLHIRSYGEAQKWELMIGRKYDFKNVRTQIYGEIKRMVRALRSKDAILDPQTKKVIKERLKEQRKRERRVMKTASQTLAARVAEIAKRNGAGVWYMEDLSPDIKAGKPWLARHWAPGAVKDAIRWQAIQCGARLEFVNPRYTSQRCSKCGHIDPDNRPKETKGQSFFQCVKCNYKNNADKNAARNISTPGIEKIIDKWVEQNKVEKVLQESDS